MVFLPYYRWQILQILNIDADKEIIVISRQTFELTMNEGCHLIGRQRAIHGLAQFRPPHGHRGKEADAEIHPLGISMSNEPFVSILRCHCC